MRQEEANGTEPFDGDATSNDRLGVADNPSQEAAISSYRKALSREITSCAGAIRPIAHGLERR
jgi:hypothetical protein